MKRIIILIGIIVCVTAANIVWGQTEGVINYEYDLATGRHTRTCSTNTEVAYGYDTKDDRGPRDAMPRSARWFDWDGERLRLISWRQPGITVRVLIPLGRLITLADSPAARTTSPATLWSVP